MQMTSDEELRTRLLTAYQQDPDRSKMGRLRKQFDTIIDLQKGGMSLEKILAVLNADMKPEDALTMKTFNGYLYLLRKERSQQWPAVDRRVSGVESAPPKPRKPRKSSKPKASAAPDLLDGEKPGAVNTELATAEDRRKDESKKLAERYAGKSDDENGIGKYL